ncbi:homocysteine S-methyltransferase family protein [Rhizobium sp. KVB221]|uniref:Homocysteine S-methyltransferase family protein n=1 Tax=Rhizobium setariae TaxID=2801340 RepID=A0A937CMS9_9HYPH|nr:homocysteine S-methyltransferase family protein [Rhizobium setariae]MBL0373056.1 homocysteine S-methyltransferase family protein [Rhizobium setariae]
MADIRILDGGMSRELVRLGAELRQPEWSALALVNSPDIVRQVHTEFIAAGADIVTTNSYALVPFHIGEERFRTEGPALIDLSGKLARQAADAVSDRKATVAGSLPPIFGSYEPELFDPNRVQDYLSVLVAGLQPHIDVWLGETLSLIAEAEAVRTAVSDTRKPLWISFTLDDSDEGIENQTSRLRSGELVADAAEWAVRAGVAVLLFNCSKPEVMEAAIATAARIRDAAKSRLELGVYANAFETESDDGAANETLHSTRDDLTADAYTDFAARWARAGATVIGGCCGIGAAHICRLANRLKDKPLTA